MECRLEEMSCFFKHASGADEANFKNDIASQNLVLESKRPNPNLMILLSLYSKKNFLPNEI